MYPLPETAARGLTSDPEWCLVSVSGVDTPTVH